MTPATVPPPTAHASIDVRTVAPYQRHALIFTTFDDLGIGQTLELTVDHEPKPLFAQFRERSAGAFDWAYLEQGPDLWRVAVTKLKASHQCCGSCGG